jgi:ribonuclease BN (tRNA processing enzyme)
MAMRKVNLDLGAYEPVKTAIHVGRWRYERKLPLHTDGQLRAMALGVGSAFSTRMYQSNLILVKGPTSVFVDLGSTSSFRLAEFHRSVHDVRHLIITHSHADHVGAFEELALKRRYEAPFLEVAREENETGAAYMQRVVAARQSGRFRPTLYVPAFYAHELWDMTLRGGLAFSEEVELKGPEGGMRLENFVKTVHPPRSSEQSHMSWEVDIEGMKIKTFVTRHVPEATAGEDTPHMYSIGLVVDDRLYISGDTQFDPDAIELFGKDCEMLWHDCQHFPGGVHANYEELKTLPKKIRARMHLYHLSDGMLDLDVKPDGFAGLLEPAPMVYDFD